MSDFGFYDTDVFVFLFHRPVVIMTRDTDPIQLLCKPMDIFNICTDTIIFIVHIDKIKVVYFFTDIS